MINLPSWKNVGKTARAALAKSILDHFHFVVDSNPKTLKKVGHAAILIAGKASKQWKSRLVCEFALRDLSPLNLFPQIHLDEWTEFVRMKKLPEFASKSVLARELAKRHKHPHIMGTAGYAGMHTVRKQEDEKALSAGKPIPLGHIKCLRTRAWTRARTKPDKDTGMPTIVKEATRKDYAKLVRSHLLKLMSSTICMSSQYPSLFFSHSLDNLL